MDGGFCCDDDFRWCLGSGDSVSPSPKSTSPSSEHINPIPSNVSMTILVFIYIYLLAKCCYLRFQENPWSCCGMFACKMHVNFSLENI